MQEPAIPATVPELVRRFRERGARPLLVQGDERVSYADAAERSARLARAFLARGLAKGARVGVWMPNGPGWLTAFLAAARIGCVVVPIDTFAKPRELRRTLEHADVHALCMAHRLAGADASERLEACAPGLAAARAGALHLGELPQLRQVFVAGGHAPRWALGEAELLAAADAVPALDDAFLAAVERTIAPADPLVVLYTSGSTGDPKGAIHSHGSALRHAHRLNAFRDLRGDDRIYSPMPWFWVGGFVFSLLSALHLGACLLCEELFEPGETLRMLERERATVAACWPHHAKALVEHASFAGRDLSSLRAGNLHALLPGAPRVDPGLRPGSLGMTETLGPHSIDPLDRELPERLRGSFGRAAPGIEHRIVDPETGAVLPPGASGEICVRGESLMAGLHRVERADAFTRDGFYRTGDRGRLDADGVLFFEGRLGDRIKSAGANVEPREVELAIEASPEVHAAFVVGLPDAARGELVAAAVVLAAGRELSEAELRRRLRAELAAYKVPRQLCFAAKAELPFSEGGKIERRRLAAWLAARVRGAGGDGGAASRGWRARRRPAAARPARPSPKSTAVAGSGTTTMSKV